MKQILFILSVVFIFGCSKYTAEKAVNDLNKAYTYYRDTTGHYTRIWFPCIITKSDTTVVTKDSVIYIECPDELKAMALPANIDSTQPLPVYPESYWSVPASDFFKPDTVVKVKTVRVPVTLPIRYITIKEKVEDSAKSNGLWAMISRRDEVIEIWADKFNKERVKAEKSKQEKNWWRKWCLITWGLLVLYVSGRIYKKTNPVGILGGIAKFIIH